MTSKPVIAYINKNIPIDKVGIGLPIFDDYANVIGNILTYDPETGQVIMKIYNDNLDQIPDLLHIITSEGI